MNQGILESLPFSLPPSLSLIFLPCHSRKKLLEYHYKAGCALRNSSSVSLSSGGWGAPCPQKGLWVNLR